MRILYNSLILAITVISFSGCTPDEDIDLEAPGVAIISPSDGASLSGSMELLIEASDNRSIDRILVTLDETPVAILEQEPFQITINLSIYKSGTYTLTANALDPSGNSAAHSITVTVEHMDRPIGLVASKGTFGDKIEVDWDDIPGAQMYQLYRLNSESVYVQITETNQSQFEDLSAFEPLTKVYYKVRVFNSSIAYSDFSDLAYGYTSGKTYDLFSSFGSFGMEEGRFLYPEHLQVDDDDNIYVSDANMNRIQKFGPDGSLKEVFYSCNSCRGIAFVSNGNTIVAESADNKITILDPSKQVVKQWGSYGTADGQFYFFRQIALDNENKLYVADHGNDRVQKFDLEGNFEMKWGGNGTGQGQFVYPVGIVFYKEMVAVASENRVQFFTKSGTFIKQLDLDVGAYELATDGSSLFIAASAYVIKTDETGLVMEKIGEGDFNLVVGVVINSTGDLITCDVYNRKISTYRKNGL